MSHPKHSNIATSDFHNAAGRHRAESSSARPTTRPPLQTTRPNTMCWRLVVYDNRRVELKRRGANNRRLATVCVSTGRNTPHSISSQKPASSIEARIGRVHRSRGLWSATQPRRQRRGRRPSQSGTSAKTTPKLTIDTYLDQNSALLDADREQIIAIGGDLHEISTSRPNGGGGSNSAARLGTNAVED